MSLWNQNAFFLSILGSLSLSQEVYLSLSVCLTSRVVWPLPCLSPLYRGGLGLFGLRLGKRTQWISLALDAAQTCWALPYLTVSLSASISLGISVCQSPDYYCVRLPEWIVTGSFWEFLQAAGGGGTALVVTLVAGRLPLWTWTGWSGLCAGTLAEQLITTSPSPALRPPLEPPHPEPHNRWHLI